MLFFFEMTPGLIYHEHLPQLAFAWGLEALPTEPAP